MSVAYIGLGSNLEQPQQQVIVALRELTELPETTFLKASSLYQSDPLGPSDQPDYINSVAALDTELSPIALLRELQTLENRHQRVRQEHWGPRTLDLDLLLYADHTIALSDLIVPHPGLAERNFVVIPLYEIAPDLQLPDGQLLVDLFNQSCPKGLKRLAAN